MKKKKFRSIIKKSVCFFVASLIALIPLIGIPFTVSAADNSTVDPPTGGSWNIVGAFDVVGNYVISVPRTSTSNIDDYIIDSDLPVTRSYWGEAHFDYNKGPGDSFNSDTPTMTVYRYRLSSPVSYSPVCLMQIQLGSFFDFVPGKYYRIIFDVTPAPGFYGWNKAYSNASNSWQDVSSSSWMQGTSFYRFSVGSQIPTLVSQVNPRESSVDLNFSDTRYRFGYQFMFSTEFVDPIDLYLVISVPYVLGISNTWLTTFVYTPIIYEYGYSQPDGSEVEDLEQAEDDIIAFVDDNIDMNWFNGNYGVNILGVDFLKGFKGAGDLLQKFYTEVPFLRSLIFFSLTLGLSAFVLNLGTSIIRTFSSKSNKE